MYFPLFVCLFVCLSVCLFVCLFVCFVSLSVSWVDTYLEIAVFSILFCSCLIVSSKCSKVSIIW